MKNYTVKQLRDYIKDMNYEVVGAWKMKKADLLTEIEIIEADLNEEIETEEEVEIVEEIKTTEVKEIQEEITAKKETTKNKKRKFEVKVTQDGETTIYKNFTDAGKAYGGTGKKGCPETRIMHQIANGKNPTARSKYYEQFKNVEVKYKYQ